MADPLSAAATAELPAPEPPSGLRRRHQAGIIFQRNNSNEEDNDETSNEGNIENRERNAPWNMLNFSPPQDTSNNNDDDVDEDVVTNVDNRRTTAGGQPSPPITNLFSPLSGSVGIGMFRISRLYCFLSILTALIAIVLSPVPTHKIRFHDVAAIIYEEGEGNDPLSQDNPSKELMREANFIVDNMNSIVTDLKLWSVEEFITRAAFLGATSSRNRGAESQIAAIINSERKGSKQGKRRRRAPVSKEETSAEKRSVTSTLSKPSRQSSGNANRNDNADGRLSVPRSRNWIERTSSLLEETMAEIVKRRKMKVEMFVEQKSRRRGSRQNEDITGDAVQFKGNTGDGSCEIEANESNKSIEHARELTNEDWKWIDPIFLQGGSFSYIFTNVIDKILKSTIRLCVITNFLLTMTYLLHSAVAAWFLSHSGAYSNTAVIQRQSESSMREDRARIGTEWSFASPSGATVARERMGGFLIFKLLLISAVLTPDALDLMILVTWFTLLGCLRSLDHLAHSTNIHLVAVGQPPKKGIVQLLFWVLSCDIIAAGSCVALFHTAGYGMVLLLTCDCALLGTDAVSHILKYYQSVWENAHENTIQGLEEQQLNLHRANEHNSDDDNIQPDDGREESSPAFVAGPQDRSSPTTTAMTREELQRESGHFDHQMEDLELAHTRRLSILDTAIFCLDMTCHILTVAHFCHIWALHGVQFTLIDGVLALHLHSAISTACAKLARRRNVHKISQDLEGHFPNATDEELKQASIDGDVCCICLGSMSKGSNVKKAPCGHMYHTHCLREVIERAQSLESAKCPLCRAPLVDHGHSTTDPSPNNFNFIHQTNTPVGPRTPAAQPANRTIDSQIEGDGGDNIAAVRQVEEQAVFRFSTEGILPAWLPVPAFSFEVVRRPPVGAQRGAQTQNQEMQTATAASTQRVDPLDIISPNQGEANPELPRELEIQAQQMHEREQDTRMPFFQRVLLFTGLMPMSPEEEARALAQLVDMFPQYDRSDLSRELRNRGSLEAVTEAILIGMVPGVPRGE